MKATNLMLFPNMPVKTKGIIILSLWAITAGSLITVHKRQIKAMKKAKSRSIFSILTNKKEQPMTTQETQSTETLNQPSEQKTTAANMKEKLIPIKDKLVDGSKVVGEKIVDGSKIVGEKLVDGSKVVGSGLVAGKDIVMIGAETGIGWIKNKYSQLRKPKEEVKEEQVEQEKTRIE